VTFDNQPGGIPQQVDRPIIADAHARPLAVPAELWARQHLTERRAIEHAQQIYRPEPSGIKRHELQVLCECPRRHGEEILRHGASRAVVELKARTGRTDANR